MRQLLCVLMLWLPLPHDLAAQEAPEEDRPAILIADEIEVTRDRVLVARGNVEAFQGQTYLQAESVRYDQNSEQLTITGPIVINDGEGVRILADAAQLDRDLQNGLLNGARLVLNEQLQLASVEMNRVNGRYTQLYKTAVTSCRICGNDPRPPLWQIRAKRVVHDQEEQQIYFDGAQFRIRSVPIFYLPRLRLPDPTLDRATGVLFPRLRTTSNLGTGLKVPYFIKLGDHRDLTLTPYLSGRTRTLEFRYRQAFRRGRIEFNGAYTRDDERPGETRGYLFGFGRFDLRNDFVLNFDLETTSDDAYLKDYGYSEKDRLDSAIQISRARRDQYISFGATNFKTLRDNEENAILPTNVLNAVYEQRVFPRQIGGEVRLALNAHSHFRRSSLLSDGPDFDDISDGADIVRLSADLSWLRTFTFAGVRAQTELGVAIDAFEVKQDPNFPNADAGTFPRAAITLRYPLMRREENGAMQYLEPVVQAGWTGGSALDVPNEESTRVEFDEGNLLSLSRFPSADRRELGAAVALGVNWARIAPESWEANLTIGQVLRDEADDDFTTTSGLSGSTTDFLVAGQMKLQNGLAVSARTLFNESFDFSKAEVRGSWATKRVDVGGSYLWLGADPEEERADRTSELALAGTFALDRHWDASVDWRYDLEDGRSARAGLGVTYNNECVSVGLSVIRRYTSSTSLEPSTDLGFTVALKGFAVSNGTEKYQRSCGN